MNNDLYARILGSEWWALAENVRYAHSVGSDLHGDFRVTHGAGRFASLLLKWSKLPQATPLAKVCVKIIRMGARERWERQFNQVSFVTLQWEGNGGQLVERFGVWEFYFKVRVERGGLFYDQQSARLCLGGMKLTLPHACAPFVHAEESDSGRASVKVSVKVTLPLVGILIAYDGHLDLKAART